MAIPYIQPTMALVRAVDGTFISYPFIEDGDTTTKVYNMVCTQQATDYSASQISLDTTMLSAAAAGVLVLPFTGDAQAYFVGDTGHAPIGGGMISFTRTFANLPQSTTVASGSAFVSFPGVRGIYGAVAPILISSLSMTAGTKGVTLTTSTAHGFAVNNNINVSMVYTVGADPFLHSTVGTFRVLAVPTTTTLTIDTGHYWDSQVTLNLDEGRISQVLTLRDELVKNVSTQTRYDYLLPGVTPGISSSIDINLPPAFAVSNISNSTFTSGFLSVGTSPSATQYQTMINDEAQIVIESSLAEWAGNILVMKTKTCKAR